MTGPHPPTLLEDVLWKIISFVDRDRNTLCACALVNKDWYPVFRRQLYRFVQARGDGVDKFVDSVARDPGLGGMVRELTLDSHFNDPVCAYKFFDIIIPHLTNLTSLTYAGLSIPYRNLPSFSSGWKSLTFLRLEAIKAHSFEDFIQLVSFHKGLQELEIYACSWRQPNVHHHSIAPCSGSNLQELRLYEFQEYQLFDILRWLAKGNRRVRYLEIEGLGVSGEGVVNGPGHNTDSTFPRIWRDTLEAVSLEFPGELEELDTSTKEYVISTLIAIIKFCHNLNTVRLRIGYDTLHMLGQVATILTGLTHLRRIALVFDFPADASDVLLGNNEITWTDLDQNLADLTRFGSLQYVEVQCGWKRKEEQDEEDGDEGNGMDEDDEGWGEDEEMGEEHEWGDEEMDEDDEEAKGEVDLNETEVEAEDLPNFGVPQANPPPSPPQAQNNPGGPPPDMPSPELRNTMDRITDFEHRKKLLINIFPRLSASGILWCGFHHPERDIARLVLITADYPRGMDWAPESRLPLCVFPEGSN